MTASAILFVACAAWLTVAQSQPPLLLRDPSLSRTQIAFAYAGDIWIAKRGGRNLRQLTHGGHDSKPSFSPDGSSIAYAGEYDGVAGVYVVSVRGGEPRRLIYHPADLAGLTAIGVKAGDFVGWSPDGKRVLFSSRRAAFANGVVQLFSVPMDGGFPSQIPLVRAAEAALSPDGARIAYVPHFRWQREWQGYRGGQVTSIQIVSLADSNQEVIPSAGGNDFNPMWVGDVIYFLSDRDGPVSLFFYDLKRKQVGRLSRLGTADIKSAAASAGAIAYEQFGSLHLLDLRSGRDTALDLRPMGDFSETRPRRLSVVDIVESPSSFFKPAMVPGLAPDGASAAFAVRGEIVAASVEEGKSRVLTHTSNAVERDPVWSPDGRSIAYFSDESGEYALHVRAASGDGTVDKIDLGSPPGFYHSPVWSPDSSKIAYGDQNLGYWYMDLRKRVPVKVDSNPYAQPLAAQWIWSPDSRSLAYTKQLTNRLHAVFIYSLAERESRQLTDGMSDALYPAFDPTGGRLYFTASITVGSKPMTRCVYAVALHPFRRGETQPVVRLPIAERNYYGLWAGKDGVLYLTEAPQTDDSFRLILGDPALTVQRFDPRTGETKAILGQISHLNVSYAGSKLLYATQAQGERRRWLVASDGKPGVPLKFGSLALDVEPRTEWRHMYEQVWRNERDFFYDPGLHGLDLVATKEKYRAFVDRIASRDDLDYLFREMLSNLAVGHMTIAGPDSTLLKPRASGIGLLGADYLVEHGRYRFARIYAADPWSSQSRSPLAEPGKMVRPGEYLLAVNGRKARSSVDVYSYFVGTAGKPTVLSVGPHSNGRDARDIMVVPVDDESGLRHFAWIESNRRKVAEMTGGRVAYLHMPDTALAGAASFNRYFFAQRDKEALILDERYNLGGFSSEYLVDALRRPLRNYVHPRAGKDMAAPDDALFGPKALLINEMAGSGGDYLAWMFRDARLGPLIGKRTWGGLVGNYLNPGDLLDGGFVATPNAGFYNRNGDWEIENRGVPPDIEVEDDPKTTSVARDAQLEKAVEWVLARLQESQSTAGGVSHHVHEQTVFP